MTKQTFISYSKKDSEFAYRLADDLEAAGFKVWIDRSIGGGEDWRRTIESNLQAAGEVIIVVSPQSMASQWVNHEGSMAYSLKKKLFPVLYQPVESLPPWFEEYQWIDFIKKPYQTALAELVKALTPPNPIQDLLNQELYQFKQSGILIDEDKLRVIQNARDTLEISEEAEDLLARSMQKVEARRQKELRVQRELEKARQERERVTRLVGTVAISTTIVLTLIGSMFAPAPSAAAPDGMTSIELAGNLLNFQAMLASWDQQNFFKAGLSLGFEFILIIGYSTALAWGCFWAANRYRQSGRQGLARLGRLLAYGMWLAGAIDMLATFSLINMFLTQTPALPGIVFLLYTVRFSFVFSGLLYILSAVPWRPGRKLPGPPG